MVILNPMKCESCGKELQPERLGMKVEDGNLIRVCGFCGHEVNIEDGKNGNYRNQR